MWASPTFVCWRCTQRSLALRKGYPTLRSKRSITQNHLRKNAEYEKAWQEKATEIHAGRKQSMLSLLEERGFVDSIAGTRKDLDRLMTDKRVGVYLGIDPTAPSLHVGHLLPFMALFWFYIYGYHSVSLLGGATAKIGDPSGRLSSREASSSDQRKANMVSMHYQLKKLWMNVEVHAKTYGFSWHDSWKRGIANNNEWLNKLSLLEFLQVLGNSARLGPMLSRDTVRNKMEGGDGMSFSEFSYPLLQAWDWWYIYHTKHIQVQIGGSDQFGNIVAGIDAVKSILKTHPDPRIRENKESLMTTPFGFTVPLLTTASGGKFGKTAGNAIWLDPQMTSSFDLYQFFLRTADADCERYLKLMTFLPLPDIGALLKEHDEDRSKRRAQHALAREVLSLMHGQAAAHEAEMQHRNLFQTPGSPTLEGDSAPTEQRKAPKPTPWQTAPGINMQLPESLVIGQSFPRVLRAAGLVESNAEGSRLCEKGGAYVGSRTDRAGGMGDSLKFSPVKAWRLEKTQEYLIEGNMMILRVGKWKVRIVRVISDAEFKRLGLDAPGWQDMLEAGLAESGGQGVAVANENKGPAPQDEAEPAVEPQEKASARHVKITTGSKIRTTVRSAVANHDWVAPAKRSG